MKKVLMAGELPEATDYNKCREICYEAEQVHDLKLVAYVGIGLWWDKKICPHFESIANVPPEMMVDISGITCFSDDGEDAAVITIARHYKIPLVLIRTPHNQQGCRTTPNCTLSAYVSNLGMLRDMEKEVPVFYCDNPENAISALKFIMQDGLQPGKYNEGNLTPC